MLEKPVTHRSEGCRRQSPVYDRRVIASAQGAQVGSRPHELIRLGDHDPRAFGIESQALLCRRRDLDGIFRSLRLTVRDGEDHDFLLPVVVQNR